MTLWRQSARNEREKPIGWLCLLVACYGMLQQLGRDAFLASKKGDEVMMNESVSQLAMQLALQLGTAPKKTTWQSYYDRSY